MTDQTGKHTFEAGETYRTRDGREARIYATDGSTDYPIHGAVKMAGGWVPKTWLLDGKFIDSSLRANCDLLPPKKQVWVAVYRNPNGAVRSTVLQSDNAAKTYIRHPDLFLAVLGPIDLEPT